jgi:hypothetical protein
MTLGVGNIVALICIVISIIFAIVTHQAKGKLSFFARYDFRHFASKPSPRAGDHDRFVSEIQTSFTSPTLTGPDTRPASART